MKIADLTLSGFRTKDNGVIEGFMTEITSDDQLMYMDAAPTSFEYNSKNHSEMILTGDAITREKKRYFINLGLKSGILGRCVCVRCGIKIPVWDKNNSELCSSCYKDMEDEYRNKRIMRELCDNKMDMSRDWIPKKLDVFDTDDRTVLENNYRRGF